MYRSIHKYASVILATAILAACGGGGGGGCRSNGCPPMRRNAEKEAQSRPSSPSEKADRDIPCR